MNPYFEQQILSAEPVELVRLLYKRAITCVRNAREHLEAGHIAERSRAICRAYEALSELVSSLRAEVAPEVAGRLRGVYTYTQQRLLDANFQQTDVPLAEVLGLLSTLAEAWDQIASEACTKDLQRAADLQRDAKDSPWYSQALPGEPRQIAVNA